ncbi:nitrogen regulation protein NR(II) [Aidingimonas halophila]|uniref:Sensory histidine kinase/phosphatase NtrB n=1 Tax=Aidingimonas halophila TaxID=574349 RepID=A0A1H3FPA8_9GAMM|nr:nitrogen regulation protein NR(II) [Aidingimonas halophila]GHC38227.1 PAS domain-containing sensor histidine kinase [Aidingimonas halophila]SDX92637.1 two-component system, NtrC family, nitrogen regulation sensor histidine kinase GlnL [Aidingimonas halophila]
MYQRLLEHLTTAVLLLDGTLRVRWMNPAAEAMLAVSLGRVQGTWLDSLAGLEGEVASVLAKARRDFHPFTQREAQLLIPGGDAVTVDFTVTPLSDDELLLELEPRDRLLRISREEALIARQETIKVLSRGLAHEIKNPLGGIRGAAQLLERDLPDPQLAEFTHIIVEEADRLRDLVDRMLGPNRLEQHEPLNIHKVLERVRTLLIAEHAEVEVIRDYDPSLPELSGDEGQLIQAVLNVSRNAVEAMEESGIEQPTLMLRTRARRQFTLGAERHRLVCEVAIIDNGPGIPESLRETLFYPMVSGRAEGSGLGLSIAQSILHQHQGLIECDSHPGRTEFRLLIPLETPRTAAAGGSDD